MTGKLSFKFKSFDWAIILAGFILLGLNSSKSTSFRVPNLIQANQLYVTRSGNVDDAVGEFVGANDPLDDRYQIQSFRQGNPQLLPEESDNTSWGIVWTPSNIEGLTRKLTF